MYISSTTYVTDQIAQWILALDGGPVTVTTRSDQVAYALQLSDVAFYVAIIPALALGAMDFWVYYTFLTPSKIRNRKRKKQHQADNGGKTA